MSGRFPFQFSSFASLVSPRALVVAFALASAACTPKIGDKCVLSTDCSQQGDRQCDTSLPNGYCTVYNCGPNGCPDFAACYLFHPEVQGCDYNDRQPSRTSKSFCMAGCTTNSDCREGYECKDARQAPWNAILLDDNQNQPVCVPTNDDNPFGDTYSTQPDAEAPVCQAFPDIDAALPAEVDAGQNDGGATDAGVDATVDGGHDAGDAGVDATVDASDSGSGDAASE